MTAHITVIPRITFRAYAKCCAAYGGVEQARKHHVVWETGKITFLAGANSAFIEELYASYADDPGSVDPSWQQFFGKLEKDAPSVLKAIKGASW